MDARDASRFDGFLGSHRSNVDRQRALHILRDDGLWVNRMVAATVLSNFPASDTTWWALARALRDPHEAVRQTAGIVLAALPARTIDWQPVTSDLRLLLGGTNLPGIESLFDVLARTNVSPTLASPLLRGNAVWVLDHLEAETPMAGPAAHRLLVQLHRGIDLGSTRRPWAAWAARL